MQDPHPTGGSRWGCLWSMSKDCRHARRFRLAPDHPNGNGGELVDTPNGGVWRGEGSIAHVLGQQPPRPRRKQLGVYCRDGRQGKGSRGNRKLVVGRSGGPGNLCVAAHPGSIHRSELLMPGCWASLPQDVRDRALAALVNPGISVLVAADRPRAARPPSVRPSKMKHVHDSYLPSVPTSG